jgi:hypothetical protein
VGGVTLSSRKVRKILRLEARARRFLGRYEVALAAATRAKGHAHVLLDEAQVIESALSDAQLGELYRGRAHVTTTTAGSASSVPPRTTTPAKEGV